MLYPDFDNTITIFTTAGSYSMSQDGWLVGSVRTNTKGSHSIKLNGKLICMTCYQTGWNNEPAVCIPVKKNDSLSISVTLQNDITGLLALYGNR